jgi:hypothetical protein
MLKRFAAGSGEEFSDVASARRKYCSLSCTAAARYKPSRPVKARRRVFYRNPEEWREQRVWLVCGVASMYTGLDGLLGIIRYQLNRNPFDGDIYVFCDGGGTMLKYLEWEGAGFCLGKRRAQSGSYPWPPSEAGLVIELTEKEFEFLRGKFIVPTRVKKSKEDVDFA